MPLAGALIAGVFGGLATLIAASEVKFLVLLAVAVLVALAFVLSGNVRLACRCKLKHF